MNLLLATYFISNKMLLLFYLRLRKCICLMVRVVMVVVEYSEGLGEY